MEEDLKNISAALHKIYKKEEVLAMNPLSLAYLGDSLYSNFIRQYLIGRGHQNVQYMTKWSTLYVKASAQAFIIHTLMDELSAAERRIVKRGRNTYTRPPKNCPHNDYRYATGFEALVAYLYLTDNKSRFEWLCLQAIALINKKEAL